MQVELGYSLSRSVSATDDRALGALLFVTILANLCQVVMELCDVGSVATIMTKMQAPLKEPEIAVMCYQLVSALVYLHGLLLIHRYAHFTLVMRVSYADILPLQRRKS
jgi:hypothetical protein